MPITQVRGSTGLIHDTQADLVANEDVKIGDKVETLGGTSVNDGSGKSYVINTNTAGLPLDNGLYAEELVSNNADAMIVFKNDEYGTALENMIAGRINGSVYVTHAEGNIYSTGSTTWKHNGTTANSIYDFTVLSNINFSEAANLDGVEDNTTDFDICCNYIALSGGGTLVIPPGSVARIASSDTTVRDKLVISAYGATIIAPDDSNGTIILSMHGTDRIIEGGTWDGNSATLGGAIEHDGTIGTRSTVNMDFSVDSVVRDIRIRRACADAMHFVSSANSLVNNVTVESCLEHGFYYSGNLLDSARNVDCTILDFGLNTHDKGSSAIKTSDGVDGAVVSITNMSATCSRSGAPTHSVFEDGLSNGRTLISRSIFTNITYGPYTNHLLDISNCTIIGPGIGSFNGLDGNIRMQGCYIEGFIAVKILDFQNVELMDCGSVSIGVADYPTTSRNVSVNYENTASPAILSIFNTNADGIYLRNGNQDYIDIQSGCSISRIEHLDKTTPIASSGIRIRTEDPVFISGVKISAARPIQSHTSAPNANVTVENLYCINFTYALYDNQSMTVKAVNWMCDNGVGNSTGGIAYTTGSLYYSNISSVGTLDEITGSGTVENIQYMP